MTELGYFCLVLGLFLSGYALLADILGGKAENQALVRSGRNATITVFTCLTVALISFVLLLCRSDFSVRYVAAHTSRLLPLVYKITALWAGAAGSLMLWLWLQSLFLVIVFCRKNGQSTFAACARAIVNLVNVFFFLVLILDKDPFDSSVLTMPDGFGLNPYLQHPAMVMHPPALFIGYAAFAVPFAWSFASLLCRDASGPAAFFKQMRRWILIAWLFLTVGIALGAWWAYEELTWGGFWAWDPVENSSLMPWLLATALLHCSRTYSDSHRIYYWLISLSIATFSLCIFGTFLTRYGLLSSIHAFPEPGLGILFFVLLILILALAAPAIWIKHRRETADLSAAARPGLKVIILNNWLMVLLTAVILIGTIFPLLSGLLSSRKITLEADYFTKITAPGGLALLWLLSVCPYLAKHHLTVNWRIIGALLAALISLVLWFCSKGFSLPCFVLCGFAGVNLALDIVLRLTKKRNKQPNHTMSSLHWYGARIVHLGVLLTFTGIAAAGGYDIRQNSALTPGRTITIAGFDVTFDGLEADHGQTFTAVVAGLSVRKSGEMVGTLRPSLAFYNTSGQRTSEAAIIRTIGWDLYSAFTEIDRENELINLTVYFKPLMNWIWIGCALVVTGVLCVLLSCCRQKSYEDRHPDIKD
ncbi:MAG: cytochrome c-type biogenesis CcmF C-terminal domain-containing protein [Planctomycetota bacterium]